MQENEFEKQIKNMMEDFRLSPSDSVWEKVGRRLNNKRRRKTPFIFLVVAGLLTAGFFMYHIAELQQQKLNITDNNISKSIKNDSNSTQDSESSLVKKNTAKQTKSDSSGAAKQLQYNKKLYNKEKVSIKNREDDFVVNENIKISNGLIPSKKYNADTLDYLNKPTTKAYNNVVVDKPVYRDSLSANKPAAVHDATSNISQKNTNVDTSKNNSVKTDSVGALQNTHNNTDKKIAAKKLDKNSKTHNWQWGINAFYGGSNAIEGLVDFNKAQADYLSYPGSVSGFDSTHTNNPYSSSSAYHFGIMIQRKIIKNGFISAGLNFVHLSTKSNVNQKIDSTYIIRPSINLNAAYAVNEYFQPGNFSYINAYNFIELPVYFQHDFFQKKQFAISYNAGISLRQLLSSDALIYNQYNNIYFTKDELMRKTQFQFLAGLNFKLNTGKTTAIYVGPQVSYSLSNMLKNDDNGSFHFITYGLQAGLLLHKK
jgi:hypothetical protein